MTFSNAERMPEKQQQRVSLTVQRLEPPSPPGKKHAMTFNPSSSSPAPAAAEDCLASPRVGATGATVELLAAALWCRSASTSASIALIAAILPESKHSYVRRPCRDLRLTGSC